MPTRAISQMDVAVEDPRGYHHGRVAVVASRLQVTCTRDFKGVQQGIGQTNPKGANRYMACRLVLVRVWSPHSRPAWNVCGLHYSYPACRQDSLNDLFGLRATCLRCRSLDDSNPILNVCFDALCFVDVMSQLVHALQGLHRLWL